MNAADSTRHTAENATRGGDEIGEFPAVRCSEGVDRYQRDGLEEDPVSPFGSRLAEHRPAPLRLVRLQ